MARASRAANMSGGFRRGRATTGPNSAPCLPNLAAIVCSPSASRVSPVVSRIWHHVHNAVRERCVRPDDLCAAASFCVDDEDDTVQRLRKCQHRVTCSEGENSALFHHLLAAPDITKPWVRLLAMFHGEKWLTGMGLTAFS